MVDSVSGVLWTNSNFEDGLGSVFNGTVVILVDAVWLTSDVVDVGDSRLDCGKVVGEMFSWGALNGWSRSDDWLGWSRDCKSIISELVEAKSSTSPSPTLSQFNGIPLLSTVEVQSSLLPGLAKLLKLLAAGDLLLISLKFDNPKLGTSSRTQIFSPLIRVIWVTIESGSRAPSMLKEGSRGEGGLVLHLLTGGVICMHIPRRARELLGPLGLGLLLSVAWDTSSMSSA